MGNVTLSLSNAELQTSLIRLVSHGHASEYMNKSKCIIVILFQALVRLVAAYSQPVRWLGRHIARATCTRLGWSDERYVRQAIYFP